MMNARSLIWTTCSIVGMLLVGHSPVAAEPVWITHPHVAATQAISLQFRREFSLQVAPQTFPIEISADNRYILYVNGTRVDAGPSRGDLAHWRYRQIDIAPFLKRGANVIAAQVWNDGAAAGVAQISARTGFWLNGAAPSSDAYDTGANWLVRIDPSRTVVPARPSMENAVGAKYYAAGPPETIDAKALAKGWNGSQSGPTAGSKVGLRDWVQASPALAAGEASPWQLVKDRLPQMRMKPLDGGHLVRAIGVKGGHFPEQRLSLPANSKISLRLDMGAIRAACPRLVTSGGAGATIDLTYGEAPYGPDLNYLSNRGDATNGQILGLTDRFLPSGGDHETFQTHWWRAWRYAELTIKTGDQPLTLKSFDRLSTGYPFETKARFISDDPELNRIWQIGWDTVQLDSNETYMDTAYWEQLQYIGDTRIQALVSYAVSGDARLAAQAIEALANSRQDGLIQSRWPSNTFQSIPPFALLWVGMMHDYWMRQPDPAPVREGLEAMRSSLDWYGKYINPDGLVGTTPAWEFIDWTQWLSNYPETTEPLDTERCIISLMYLGALQQSADLETALGDPLRAGKNLSDAGKLADAVRKLCWSSDKGLFADHPDKSRFSQHANILAVLHDVAPKDQQKAILERILIAGKWPQAPEGMATATFYFDFYLARALDHAGMGDRYLEMLAPWRQMLRQNFTTWPEQPDPSRSDSHAWSAHPTADLLAIVGGIKPAAPGFAKVKIAPKLGTLKSVTASFAHPSGPISVRYRVNVGGDLVAVVTMPKGLEGEFEWQGTSRAIISGDNRFSIKNNDQF